MGDDSKFYKGIFLLTLTFAAGFSCGYQADRNLAEIQIQYPKTATKERDEEKNLYHTFLKSQISQN
jgi:hypothetical protein